jgi:hypothetical protein
LASLRGLEAPVDKIKWKVAEQRWQWAMDAITVVIESPASSRAQLIEALQHCAAWTRYVAFYCPKLKARAKGEWMDRWIGLCEPLEILATMEAKP